MQVKPMIPKAQTPEIEFVGEQMDANKDKHYLTKIKELTNKISKICKF